MRTQKGQAYTPDETVFEVRDLTKTYVMGEVSVHALRGANLELYAGDWLCFSGRREAGSPRY